MFPFEAQVARESENADQAITKWRGRQEFLFLLEQICSVESSRDTAAEGIEAAAQRMVSDGWWHAGSQSNRDMRRANTPTDIARRPQ